MAYIRCNTNPRRFLLVTLQQNGIEDFDTLDATVEEEKPLPQPIEAAPDDDTEDQASNKKAAALPEYNLETHADFERNQEAADWLTSNPNAYNIRSYEDTLTAADAPAGSPDMSDAMDHSERNGKNIKLRKPELHKHHQAYRASEEKSSDKGLYDDEMLYSFGDLNLKDAEGDATNSVEYTNGRNEDSYGGSNVEDSPKDWSQDPMHDDSDAAATYGDEIGDHVEEDTDTIKITAPSSQKNGERHRTEGGKITKEKDSKGEQEASPLHHKTRRRPNVLRHGKFEKAHEHGSDKTVGYDGVSGDHQLNIEVDSKTKTVHLGNMTIHISVADHLKDREESEEGSGTAGQNMEPARDEKTNGDASKPRKDGAQSSTSISSGGTTHSVRQQPLRGVPKEAPDKTKLQYNNSNIAAKSKSGTVDSTNELKELSEELKSMEELMAIFQKNNAAKTKENTPSPAEGEEKKERSERERQRLSPVEQEESATKRKQESRPDTRGKYLISTHYAAVRLRTPVETANHPLFFFHFRSVVFYHYCS